VKKFREGANVVVMFWISHFVERQNASEKIRSFVETQCKRGCSVCCCAAAAKSHDFFFLKLCVCVVLPENRNEEKRIHVHM